MKKPREVYERVMERSARELPKVKLPEPPPEYTHFLNEASVMLNTDREVAAVRKSVFEHFEKGGEFPEHGATHSEIVARIAGAIAGMEAARLGLSPKSAHFVMKESIMGGLLHDVGRMTTTRSKAMYRKLTMSGPGAYAERKKLQADFEHEVVSAREAEDILSAAGVSTEHAIEAVREHESVDWKPKGNQLRDIVVGAVHDADKVIWGPPLSTRRAWKFAIAFNYKPKRLMADFRLGRKGEVLGKLAPYESGVAFRTSVAKEYGPVFIKRGIKLGKIMIKMLGEEMKGRKGKQQSLDEFG